VKNATVLIAFILTLVGCDNRMRLPTEPSELVSHTLDAERHRTVSPVRDIPPPCDGAAPLVKSIKPSGRYLVVYRDGVDARLVTAQLSAKYAVTPIYVFVGPPFQGFSALVDAQTVALLRCEPSVDHVAEDSLLLFLKK